MLDFVLCLSEIEVVRDRVVLAAGVGEDDLELEFAPAVFFDLEGGFADGWT